MAANEPAPRIGKVLQDFGQESDGREDPGVGLEEVGAGRARDDGVRASLVDEQVLQRDGGADDDLSECLSRSGGGGGDTIRLELTELCCGT